MYVWISIGVIYARQIHGAVKVYIGPDDLTLLPGLVAGWGGPGGGTYLHFCIIKFSHSHSHSFVQVIFIDRFPGTFVFTPNLITE